MRKFFLLTMLVALIAASMAIASPPDLGSPPVFEGSQLHNEMTMTTTTAQVIDQGGPPVSTIGFAAGMCNDGILSSATTVECLDRGPVNYFDVMAIQMTAAETTPKRIFDVHWIRGHGRAPLYIELSVGAARPESRNDRLVFNTGNQRHPLAG